MRLKVLVVTHKEFDSSILPKNYQVIKVGSKLSNEYASSKGYLTDNTGDNISNENNFYCELTALYWAWKNLKDVDYIGLVHYRRYFMDYKISSTNFSSNILSSSKIEQLLKKYKLIMPYWFPKVRGGGMLYKSLPRDFQHQGWVIIEDIIKKFYPDYVDAFENILYGNRNCYQNMMIISKENADLYCAWLFDILRKYDKTVEKLGKERVSRYDGYFSEYLLNVWVVKHFTESEIYRTEVSNPENFKGGLSYWLHSLLRSSHYFNSWYRNYRLK